MRRPAPALRAALMFCVRYEEFEALLAAPPVGATGWCCIWISGRYSKAAACFLFSFSCCKVSLTRRCFGLQSAGFVPTLTSAFCCPSSFAFAAGFLHRRNLKIDFDCGAELAPEEGWGLVAMQSLQHTMNRKTLCFSDGSDTVPASAFSTGLSSLSSGRSSNPAELCGMICGLVEFGTPSSFLRVENLIMSCWR